jgi:hypothetical protein
MTRKIVVGMFVALLMSFALAVSTAKADVTEQLTVSFGSDASFGGTVAIGAGGSVSSVNGILSGYAFGSNDPAPSGQDLIQYVYAGDQSLGEGYYQAWLGDGPVDSSAWNWISIIYDTNGGSVNLDWAGLLVGDNLINDDPGRLTPVPESSALALVGVGLLVLAFLYRSRLERSASRS